MVENLARMPIGQAHFLAISFAESEREGEGGREGDRKIEEEREMV